MHAYVIQLKFGRESPLLGSPRDCSLFLNDHPLFSFHPLLQIAITGPCESRGLCFIIEIPKVEYIQTNTSKRILQGDTSL